MDVIYREATLDDMHYVHASWLRSLYHQRPDIAAGLTARGFADCYRDAFARAINGASVTVAAVGDLLIGFVISSPGGRLWYVYVSAAYRRKGVGSALVRGMRDEPVKVACITPAWDKWSKKPPLWVWKPELWRRLRCL